MYVDDGARCEEHVGEAFPPRCTDCAAGSTPQRTTMASAGRPPALAAPAAAHHSAPGPLITEGVTTRGMPIVRVSPRTPSDPWQLALAFAAAARYPDDTISPDILSNLDAALMDPLTRSLAQMVCLAISHDPAAGDAAFFRNHARAASTSVDTSEADAHDQPNPGDSQPSPALIISEPQQAALAMVGAYNDQDTHLMGLLIDIASLTNPTGLTNALAALVSTALDEDPTRSVPAFLIERFTTAADDRARIS